uniref:Uncharacterized protein n=1 Tax=Arundo donax TaxID=35708 RepID=A0A0A9DFW9_ARUDO
MKLWIQNFKINFQLEPHKNNDVVVWHTKCIYLGTANSYRWYLKC